MLSYQALKTSITDTGRTDSSLRLYNQKSLKIKPLSICGGKLSGSLKQMFGRIRKHWEAVKRQELVRKRRIPYCCMRESIQNLWWICTRTASPPDTDGCPRRPITTSCRIFRKPSGAGHRTVQGLSRTTGSGREQLCRNKPGVKVARCLFILNDRDAIDV